jgi:hypothetical protein
VRGLGDGDDVQNVFADFDVSDEIMAALDEARERRRAGREELSRIADEGGFHFERYEDLDK